MTEAKMKYDLDVTKAIQTLAVNYHQDPESLNIDKYLQALKDKQARQRQEYRQNLNAIKDLKKWLNTHSFRRCRVDCGLIVDYLTQIKNLHIGAQVIARTIRDLQVKIDAAVFYMKQRGVYMKERGVSSSAQNPQAELHISRDEALMLMQKLIEFLKTKDTEFVVSI